MTDLAGDPFSTIPRHFDLVVEEENVDPDEYSPVMGHYYPDRRLIVVGRALSRPRMMFTALHELGHHLVSQNDEIYLELQGPPPLHTLEESICDSFAGRVLIPEDLVDRLIDDRGPTAKAVAELYLRSSASRAASAVRAAERLGAPGHVMIASLDGVTQFTATRGIEYRVAPNTQQHMGVVTRAASRGSAQGNDHVTHRSGYTSEEFHVDAIRVDHYVFAVFTQGQAPWEDLHILGDSRPGPREVTCSYCGHDFEAWQNHRPCGVPECPHCGRCGCSAIRSAEEGVCSNCFHTVPTHRLVGGVCNDCR